ncbi:MAG: DNA alkylation repair protein [Verrucomicrobia bacterium]|nr:DNA alkylation repair protein [Verrucomicrobiota bacterium]
MRSEGKSTSRKPASGCSADVGEVVDWLRAHGSERNRAGMARYGIRADRAFGVSMPAMRAFARTLGHSHALALDLWASGIHEARILASLVDEPARVMPVQMDAWARDLDSWDVCDQCCLNLFRRTPHAWRRAHAWSRRRAEFVKRAGFSLFAVLAVHDKAAPDERFLDVFAAVEREAGDDRNFVRKSVNWALRQAGKRNPALRRAAIDCARRLRALDSRSARWIASDALRELEFPPPRSFKVVEDAKAAHERRKQRRNG